MGEHSAPTSRVKEVLSWVVAHKGKIASVIIAALPLVSRYVPEFPADQVLSAVRLFLGA